MGPFLLKVHAGYCNYSLTKHTKFKQNPRVIPLLKKESGINLSLEHVQTVKFTALV